jgi:hypothetical protein
VFLARAQAIFDANGVATDSKGPFRAHESWRVQQLATRTSSALVTTLTVYRYNTSGPRLDFTNKGNGDVSPCDYDVPSGQNLTFQWTGGTPGTVATCDIDGERYGV